MRFNSPDFRKLYLNKKWQEFAFKIQKRDGFKCVRCGKIQNETILQVHHKVYRNGTNPWEYPVSDCLTLCKGCHALEHDLIEPDFGWILCSISDRGDKTGTCERKRCGTSIRYEHEIYHPAWGYKIVGSTCIDYLTQEDQYSSAETLKLANKISSFLSENYWPASHTKKGKKFISTTYKHHKLIIYLDSNPYSYQYALKLPGEKWHEYSNFFNIQNKNVIQAKELAYIHLLGVLSEDSSEKQLLRQFFNSVK